MFIAMIIGVMQHIKGLPPMRNTFLFSDIEDSNEQVNAPDKTISAPITPETIEPTTHVWKVMNSTPNSVILQDANGNTREIKLD